MIVTIGIGCMRGTAPSEVLELVQATLAEAKISPTAIACVATIDRKQSEAAIDAVAARLGVKVQFFPAAELAVETRITLASDGVVASFGTPSVAEAAALLAAGPDAKLIVPKRRSAHATCAIAATGDTR